LLPFGLSGLPYGLQQGNETFDYHTQVSDQNEMILTGIENLAKDEKLINDTIAETQGGTNEDCMPPDTPIPVKNQACSLFLSLQREEYPDDFNGQTESTLAIKAANISKLPARLRPREDDTHDEDRPAKKHSRKRADAEEDDDDGDSESTKLALARIKAFLAVLTTNDDKSVSVTAPVLDDCFLVVMKMKKRSDLVNQLQSLFSTIQQSLEDTSHFLCKIMHSHGLSAPEAALLAAGKFRHTPIRRLDDTSNGIGPNSFLPPGGNESADIRDSVASARNTYDIENSMGLSVEHRSRPSSTVKIFPGLTNQYDLVKLCANVNLMLNTVLKVSKTMDSNSVIYKLIHKLADSLQTGTTTMWCRSI
jgi:hypothetical protein